MKKDYNDDIPKYCLFCENAVILNDKVNVLCKKKGVVSSEYSCRRFIYDPLKRVPKEKPKLPPVSGADLVL